MDKSVITLAAIGFGQTVGVASNVDAQKRFMDQECQIDVNTGGQCVDNGCSSVGGFCGNQLGMVVEEGQPQTELVDGCFCDPGQPHPGCQQMMDAAGAPICVDLNCSIADPTLHCDDTCNCVPTQVTTSTTTQTVPPTTVPPQGNVEFDHLKCYKIKDPQKLKGIVNLDGPQFGLEQGCKIKKASKFCVPVMKTVVEISDNVTVIPFPGQHLLEDRICYKIKCPTAPIGPVNVTDQFGPRAFDNFKATEVCTPAAKLP